MEKQMKKIGIERTTTNIFIISMLVAWLIPVDFSLEESTGLPVGALPFSELCSLARNCMPSVSAYFACMMLMIPFFVYLITRADLPKQKFTFVFLLQGTAAIIIGLLLIWQVFYEYDAADALRAGTTSANILLRFFVSTRIGMGLIGGAMIFTASFWFYGLFVALPKMWLIYIRNK